MPTVPEIVRDLPLLDHPMPDFDPAATPDTPVDLFVTWLAGAVAAGVDEPHAMTLSTVDRDGVPDARVVALLDAGAATGFRFAVRAGTPKAAQLDRGHAALSFYWREQGRQIRLRGPVADAGDEAAARDFLRRSPASRAANLVGRQSAPLESLADLDRAFEDAAAPAADLGHRLYALTPTSAEFWQGRADRRHRRLRYRWSKGIWTKELLWP